MAVDRGERFGMEQSVGFPKGLVLLGEIEPDNEYLSNDDRARGKREHQRIDEKTGKRIWKATVTDPSETRTKRAALDLRFTADVQPVPTTDEVLPGMRAIELEGLEVEPKVGGQGEFKYLTYDLWATGIKDNRTGRKSTPASGSGSSQSSAA
jgi:hypothetical protein